MARTHKRGFSIRNKSLFLIGIICLASLVFALQASPSGDTNLQVVTCAGEDNSGTSNTYATSCDSTYPANCGASGDLLSCDDGFSETHTTNGNNQFAGVRISAYNASATNCGNVTEVFLCSEWWSSSTSIGSCTIDVDANNGSSFTTMNTTCPSTSANPGVRCQNITALETWSCGNFFGTEGVNAFARVQAQATSGGSKTLTVDALFFNVSYSVNTAPTIVNITSSATTIKGGNTLTIYANTSSHGVNDSEQSSLTLYCDSSSTPTAANTDCTSGTTTDTTYPYVLSCAYAVPQTDIAYTEFCRVYDGSVYSSVVNTTYTVDSTAPSLAITSVGGDTAASYFDTTNDGVTLINITGETGMTCRWSSSDTSYSGMSSACTISGATASCAVSDVASQGFTTRSVACQDSLTNELNATTNLDVSFYLDYTAPTTTTNAVTDFQAPNYTITVTELDNVDADVSTLYCSATSVGCTPLTTIDNGGTITYTASNRGTNYLRLYSTDDAGNVQTILNQTIRINQLPVFSSASDNAGTIQGGATVNITTIVSDPDAGQSVSLYVCSSTGANLSGCTGTEYCAVSGSGNLTCTFSAESDSAAHTWYAYIFDSAGEQAAANPLTGSYTTDTTAPTLALLNPTNGSTLTQNSVTITLSSTEALSWAGYSLNGGANVSLSNTTATSWTFANTSIANGLYNLTISANDSYNNRVSVSGYSFTIDTTAGDTTAPAITIRSPTNGSYVTNSSTLLNITSDEALSWAGYSLNGGALTTLGNISLLSWNSTLSLSEGVQNLTVYANDSSSNKNQANSSLSFTVDLNNPQIASFLCSSSLNESTALTCSINLTDSVGLSAYHVGWNLTGSWQNSSSQSISGRSSNTTFTIAEGNTTTPGPYSITLWTFDLAGRTNSSTLSVTVIDTTFPTISNIVYTPNTTDSLDPGVLVMVNATIGEEYNLSSVVLMYQNASAGVWTTVTMTNRSALTLYGASSVVYNASFTPGNDTWTFKINATDSQGNQNISSSYTISVQNDTSFRNTTTLPVIYSLVYAQRAGNTSLGTTTLNNTGDSALTFTVNITSAYASRFNVNYTSTPNASYVTAPGANQSLVLLFNTSSLTAGLYAYNMTISSDAGTTTYERYVNVQTAEGPYLQLVIDTFTSTVTTSQTGITYRATVTNLGTQDALQTYLNWTLPSIFTLTSGSLSRNLGTLPLGSSGTNTITVQVGSATTDATYAINASATAVGAESVNATKAITVSDPVTIIQTTTTTSSSGGGSGGSGGGGGGTSIVFYKTLELVRGEQDYFEIEVTNTYTNATLEGLTLNVSGFLAQYITVSPTRIASLGSGQKGIFKIHLVAPVYKEAYEEHTLKAIISGSLVTGASKQSYTDIRNLKLIIQEVSLQNATLRLREAEQAIAIMQAKEFNTAKVTQLYTQAQEKLKAGRNKEAYTLAENIIETSVRAIKAYDLITRVAAALADPQKTSLLTGNVIDEIEEPLPLFGGESSQNLLELALAAFERGDYEAAETRAKTAQTHLLLERKGNLGVFIYLYWQFILVGLFVVLLGGMLSYRTYHTSSITRRIEMINKREQTMHKVLLATQKSYYSGAISGTEYNRAMHQHDTDLAQMRQERIGLRTKRVHLLDHSQLIHDLQKERLQIEAYIKALQESYYRQRAIPENQYTAEFKILNERLAEIEDERITAEVSLEKKNTSLVGKKESLFLKILLAPGRLIRGVYARMRTHDEQTIKKKVDKLLSR